ncbi:MAG: patatin family protein [Firmicutes bacterium]|nr:patatin family protein [Bacillota bacterium]
MKTGIIDVGGGMRDIYGVGVLDRLMDLGIRIDCCIGVSAGAANLSSYLAGQRGRNYRFYMEYSHRSDYMGFHNLAMTGSYINLDYIYGELSNTAGEYPLDYDAMKAEFEKGRQFIIVATDAETGKPVYFDGSKIERDNYGVIGASSCVPIVNRAYTVNGREYFDGGLGDPIPIDKALEAGCDRVVILLTRPKDYYCETMEDIPIVKLLELNYPNCAKKMAIRGDVYNWNLDKAKDLEKEGKVLIVAPDSIGDMRMLKRRNEDMEVLYRKGYRDADAILKFLPDEKA